MTPKNFVDLTGRRFGRLVVVKRAPSRKGVTFWLCHCDCGHDKEIGAAVLVKGHTKSCGCFHRERMREVLGHDLTGKRFGRLVVKQHAGFKGPYKTPQWLCECDCGNTKTIAGQELRVGKTKSCGCLQREVRGDNPDRYRAMLTHVCKMLINRAKDKKLDCNISISKMEELILSPCHYCGREGGNLKADKFSDVVLAYNGLDRINPALGYILDNVVPCCWECNRAKGTLLQEEFKALIERIHKHYCSHG